MTELVFDVVVIGGGPGGYAAAIKAAQLGLQVACVEKRATLGGTCLNVGCIPSKALLESSEKYQEAQVHLADHGVNVGDVSLDLAAMMRRKAKIVTELTGGIEFLFRKNKIAALRGHGRITGPNTVEVMTEGQDAPQVVQARTIVIATGSEVAPLPGATVDEQTIVTSTGALALERVPDHLVVVGGGYIGLELGTVWHRLGAKVTVVEYAEALLPMMDSELGKALHRTLGKQGLQFMLGAKVEQVTRSESGGVQLQLAAVDASKPLKETSLLCDVVLLSVGRRPYTEALGLETVGITLDERGRIPVNAQFQTAVPSIFAIGDVIRGAMLAHKAEEEGIAVAEILAGQRGHVNYDAIPSVIYTWPEVASVGRTEEELKKAQVAYKVGKFPFSANSRAKATGQTDGFVKILADAHTDEVLGVHIIGPHAGTIIAEAVVGMEFRAASEDLARICHAHPTLNEAVKEAALAVTAQAIHM